jgi:hypothetical protein
MRHIAAYMVNIGLLTRAEGLEAFTYVGPCDPEDRPLRRTKQIVGSGMEFRRNECAKFVDWLFLTGRQNQFEFSHFILRIVKDLCLSGARRLNNQGQRPTLKGLDYFHDALSSAAVDIMYGGTYRRILKLENWKNGPVIKYKFQRMRKGTKERLPYLKNETRTRKTIIINGRYTVVASDLMMEFLEDEIGEFFVLNEHKHADEVWSAGRKMRHGSSMTLVAIGIARSNFVGMEIGRYSHKWDPLAEEHRDSRRSRKSDTREDIYALSMGFCETSQVLDDDEKRILRVELERPTHLETNAYDYYVATTLDQPHKRAYYRKLEFAKEQMLKFFEREE